jgi:hypothetical protein
MTIVNPQITDTVAPPSLPSAQFDGVLEQALARAANDAVAAQQQFYILAQAATTQSVATMLSIDTAATSLQVQKDLDGATAALRSRGAATSVEDLSVQGDDVIRASSVAHEMNALGETYCRNLMRVVQIVATSVCATAMVARPEQFDLYAPILEAIKKLV